jgi:hypothetical protein
MIELPCPACGQVLHIPDQYAGQSGRCTHCGGPVQVPPADGGAGSNYVEPVSFGHFSRAAEARWVDPTAPPEAMPDDEETEQTAEPAGVGLEGVPEEVLEKHRARKRQQRLRILGAVVAASLVLLLAALAATLLRGCGAS